MKRLTKEEFVNKVCEKFGDVIDFENVEYKNVNTKIEYYCREGHYNNRKPTALLYHGVYCSACYIINRKNAFVDLAKQIHGENRYDYSLVDYVDGKIKVKVICKEHGIFEVTPDNHIRRKSGCSKCSNNKRLTTEEFILSAKRVHGENRYDYSQVEYIDSHTKVKIICPIHGMFEMKPNTHISRGKCGCRKCGEEKLSLLFRSNLDEFVQKANQVHGIGRYDYSEVEYINANIKVKIYCPIHKHFFFQSPHSHIDSKSGCSKCSAEKFGDSLRSNTAEFIQRSKNLHGENRYDYSLVNYITERIPVILICNIHNKPFEVPPSRHFRNLQGCPYCKRSYGEIMIRNSLDELNYQYKPEHRFNDCRLKYPLPFDFVIFNDNKSIKFLCEMQGQQHFQPVCFGGMSKERAEENFIRTQLTDSIKKEYCEKNGIPLLCIHYSDINNIPKILPQFIRSLDDLLEAL